MVWLFQAWLPGYLEIQRHMSIRTTGVVAAIPYACGVVGSPTGIWNCASSLRPYDRAAAAYRPDDLFRLALDVRLHGSSRDRRRYRVVHRLSGSGGGGAFPGRSTPPDRGRGGAGTGTARDTG